MRKLASIQKIIDIEPIENADNIVVATVLGWQVVIKKGDFEVGDLCVYVEVDSILPDWPEFEFLGSRKRIKTVKLRGQISQGICFPLSILPKDFSLRYEEDLDVTDILEITKFEPFDHESLSGVVKSSFPGFIPKTDETRVQVLQKLLDKYKGETFYQTEKLDGSSATFYLRDNNFGVCSRNQELKEDDNNKFWSVAKKLNIENKLRRLGKDIAIQGELVGPGIQNNKLQLQDTNVFFFNVFDIKNYNYYNFNDFINLMRELELQTVPIINDNFILNNDIKELVELSKQKSKINHKVWCEGYVFRPINNIIDKQFKSLKENRVSFKVINPNFLIKYSE